MADPELTKLLSSLNHVGIIILIIVVILFVVIRFAIYKYIEKAEIFNILPIITENKILKFLYRLFRPDTEYFEKQKELFNNTPQNIPVKILYNPNGQQSTIEYENEKIIFSGQRALILSFFFNEQQENRTYHDFNAWLKKSNITGSEIDPRLFRQEIDEINRRLAKDSKFLSTIIELMENGQQNKTKANFYKFKIILKKS